MSDAVASRAVETGNPAQLLSDLLNLDSQIQELRKQQLSGAIAKEEYESKLMIAKKQRRQTMSQLQELLKNDPELAKQLRFKLYGNRTAQLLLSGFIGGMINELLPSLDSDRNVRYPILENIDETTAGGNVPEILNELAYAGILDKKLYERIASCPKCGSHSQVFLRIKCPECGSLQLDSSKLVEHLVCGAVHEYEQYVEGGQIRCPSCKEPLVKEGEDYRIVGTFNQCESCRIHFDDPAKSFYCRACQMEFDIKDAQYYDAYAFTLSEAVLSEVKGIIGLPVFKTTLEELGFTVELPGAITGSSGMIQNFTLTGTKNGRGVAIDVVESEGEVDEKELFAFFTKITDLKSTFGILVAVPRLSSRAKEFATRAFSKGDIDCVEAASPAQAVEQLREKLQQIV
jgi:hypothetical protein